MSIWRLAAAVTLMACAVVAPAEDERGGRSEAVIAGDYFGAGGALEPGEAVDGDAFVAGGQVALRVPVAGDAVLSGGSINVAERVGGDLYAGGGSISVGAVASHKARLAGGRVQLTRAGGIDAKATLTGGAIEIDGAVGGQLTAFGGTVRIDGNVGGDVTVAARSLVLGPAARIDGRLTYRGPSPAEVHPQAVIGGGMNYLVLRFEDERLKPLAKAVAWGGAAAFTAGLFLIGLLAIVMLPQTTASSAGVLRSRPFSSLGLGFALVVCVPVAAILAMATLIGIPLGILLLFAYPVLLMLGYLLGVMSVSDALANLFARGKLPGRLPRILLLAALLIGLLLLARVPVAGWIVGPLLMLAGVGGLILAVFGRR